MARVPKCPGQDCMLNEATLAPSHSTPKARAASAATADADATSAAASPIAAAAATSSSAAAAAAPQAKDGGALAVDEARQGHEWAGGATGFIERAGAANSYGPKHREPRNATLLLFGVLSGSKNFDCRSWVRRSFWRQRAWAHGVHWRFVVGTTLPRGDNDRVSLGYEAERWGDIDIVRGTELPPGQASVALHWWLHAARLAARPGAPLFFGLSSDATLVALPRLAARLGAALASRQLRATPAARRFVYGGELRWASWADGAARAGRVWRCVAEGATAAAGEAFGAARLAGDTAPAADALRPEARARLERLVRGGIRAHDCAGGRGGGRGPPPTFLAASPALQLVSAPLLLRARAPLGRRIESQTLEAAPPPSLWDRSTAHHQTAAGRTPNPPALLAATALGRAVHNVSAGRTLAYLQLGPAAGGGPFDWEAQEARPAPSARELVVRGVTDGLVAETVTERMVRQLETAGTPAAPPQPRVRCGRRRCAAWGVPDTAGEGRAVCCEVEGARAAAHSEY